MPSLYSYPTSDPNYPGMQGGRVGPGWSLYSAPQTGKLSDRPVVQALGQASQLMGATAAEAGAIPTDWTPAQEAAIRRAAIGGIGTGMQAQREEAARRMSASGSPAGMAEMGAEMGREQSRQQAQAAGQFEAQRAEVPVSRALARAGILTPLATAAEGSATNLFDLQQKIRAGQPQGLQKYLQGAGEIGGAIGGALFGL